MFREGETVSTYEGAGRIQFPGQARQSLGPNAFSVQMQRPFRGSLLWLFGAPNARLTSLQIGNDEQLTQPIEFSMFRRDMLVEQFRACVEHGASSFNGNAVHPLLLATDDLPPIQLPTISPGVMLTFRYEGDVRGVVLVGHQIL